MSRESSSRKLTTHRSRLSHRRNIPKFLLKGRKTESSLNSAK